MAALSYSKIAGLALPPVVLVLGLFVFMHLRQPELVCPPAEPAAPAAPVAPAAPGAASSTEATKEVFDSIYASGTWGTGSGGAGTSGSGSTLEATAPYRAFLQQFMKDNHITSVVDAGCGDWEFSQAIDWTGIDYKGYDIVDSVVAADKAKYGKPNIQFVTANIVDTDLPPADLLICKEVLQHLPNADVAKFLAQLPKYKHVLIMNAVNPVALTAKNNDITLDQVKVGGYRNLDITRPPFNIPGIKILTYWANRAMHQVVYVARGAAPTGATAGSSGSRPE